MQQYETFELKFNAQAPAGSWVDIDLNATFSCDGDSQTVRGFYAGNSTYIVRFYPTKPGHYRWQTTGVVAASGEEVCEPAVTGHHGMVRRDGLHFKYDDGSRYQPFGTTVYALLHQDRPLIDQTMATLAAAPFNKVRLCVFPKHYDYNYNEPDYFAFEKTDGQWDVHRPCFPFWDALENRLRQLADLGIEADLILFHPYDRWGFAKLSLHDCLVYLDYLTRRLSAIPNVWWSLANEYDLMTEFAADWWPTFAHFIAEHDPASHLLSNHNFIRYWNFADPATSHCCIQGNNVEDVGTFQQKYGKPVVFDECRYEGNLPHSWGNISAFEMVNRFWKACTLGGYCTHGETYLNPEEIVWWSRGGRLIGQSPARIRFLRETLTSLPGPLEPVQSFFPLNKDQVKRRAEHIPPEMADNPIFKVVLTFNEEELARLALAARNFAGHFGDQVFLHYLERMCTSKLMLQLPADKRYRVEVIDVWEMTRKVVLEGVSGQVEVGLPGKEGMAVLATRI
ncbi:MAG TPA: hypothetical protein DCM45_01645 [Clostridiales bacterium]|nr:hypothetical protein [Clostridiales bacterium]